MGAFEPAAARTRETGATGSLRATPRPQRHPLCGAQRVRVAVAPARSAALAAGLPLLCPLAGERPVAGTQRCLARAGPGTGRKKKAPSAAIFDAQSVKVANHPGMRGYDAGKKIRGRKRHLVVD